MSSQYQPQPGHSVQPRPSRTKLLLQRAATVSEEAKSTADAKSHEVDELIHDKRSELNAMITTGRESLNIIKDQVIAGQQIERADHEYEAYVKAVKEARWWLIAALIGVVVGIVAVWANPQASTFAAWLSRGGVSPPHSSPSAARRLLADAPRIIAFPPKYSSTRDWDTQRSMPTSSKEKTGRTSTKHADVSSTR